MNRLAGKTAIVTGGAVGIGQACVRRMSEEGAKVAIFDLLESDGRALADEVTAKEAKLHTGRSTWPTRWH